MAGLGRSQGSRYGLLGVLGALKALIGFGSKEQDRLTRGDSSGFPLAKKYLRTQNTAKATGRDQSPYIGGGTRAHNGNRCQHHGITHHRKGVVWAEAEGGTIWAEVDNA